MLESRRENSAVQCHRLISHAILQWKGGSRGRPTCPFPPRCFLAPYPTPSSTEDLACSTASAGSEFIPSWCWTRTWPGIGAALDTLRSLRKPSLLDFRAVEAWFSLRFSQQLVLSRSSCQGEARHRRCRQGHIFLLAWGSLTRKDSRKDLDPKLVFFLKRSLYNILISRLLIWGPHDWSRQQSKKKLGHEMKEFLIQL